MHSMIESNPPRIIAGEAPPVGSRARLQWAREVEPVLRSRYQQNFNDPVKPLPEPPYIAETGPGRTLS